MSETQLSIESLQQTVKALQEQVQQMQASLVKAGLMVVEEGVTGVYEGEFMTTPEGQRFQVPANYASKTMLVSGDHLRMVEAADGGQAKFKQIVKVERLKAEGLLAKKDGKYEALTDQGSFKVLAAAVKHYDGQPGDRVMIQYPKQHVKGSWAAIEKLISAQPLPTMNTISGDAGSIALPTVNMVQVKHAPQPHQQPVAAQSKSEVTPVPSTESSKPVETAESKPASNQPKKTRQPVKAAEPKSESQQGSSKPSGGRSKSKSKPKPKPGGSGGQAKATAPHKPASQQARPVEQSLPLDKGEITPVIDYDEDELM